jgi:hypothetical protein
MKKVLAPILLVCYLAFTSGVMVNFHYCMNRLASTELFAMGSESCGKCGMDIDFSHGCCRDEVKIVKIDDDQKTGPAFILDSPLQPQLFIVPSEFIVASFENVPNDDQYWEHSPPLITKQDSFLRNRVFRI